MPCVMMVDSSATTGWPASSAFLTAGEMDRCFLRLTRVALSLEVLPFLEPKTARVQLPGPRRATTLWRRVISDFAAAAQAPMP